MCHLTHSLYCEVSAAVAAVCQVVEVLLDTTLDPQQELSDICRPAAHQGWTQGASS